MGALQVLFGTHLPARIDLECFLHEGGTLLELKILLPVAQCFQDVTRFGQGCGGCNFPVFFIRIVRARLYPTLFFLRNTQGPPLRPPPWRPLIFYICYCGRRFTYLRFFWAFWARP